MAVLCVFVANKDKKRMMLQKTACSKKPRLYFLLIITYKKQSNFVQIFAKSNFIQLEIDFIAHEKH